MNCSYCCDPLPEESAEADKLPLGSKDITSCLHLEDKQGNEFLHLHGECVREVVKGLQFGERLVMN